LELCLATARGELASFGPLAWRTGACVAVVLASGGYPGSYSTGYPIQGLDTLPEGGLVFHAGTALHDSEVRTVGGRVLAAVGRGPTIPEARRLAYATADGITFEGVYRRDDIALREEVGAGSQGVGSRLEEEPSPPAATR
jgi:phosphoribosylamine--glycine ligase